MHGDVEFLGEGADIKRIHPGKAARDGVLCAELGRRRITGPTRVLEGKNGFFKAFVESKVNWERLMLDLGTRCEIEDIYFKPYPCCRHLHPIMDGIQTLKEKHRIDPAKVPAEIIRKLNADMNAFLKAPDMQQRWIEMGVVPMGGSPADAEKFFASEREKWSKVIKTAGIRGD